MRFKAESVRCADIRQNEHNDALVTVWWYGLAMATFNKKHIDEAREFAALLGPAPEGYRDWQKADREWHFAD